MEVVVKNKIALFIIAFATIAFCGTVKLTYLHPFDGKTYPLTSTKVLVCNLAGQTLYTSNASNSSGVITIPTSLNIANGAVVIVAALAMNNAATATSKGSCIDSWILNNPNPFYNAKAQTTGLVLKNSSISINVADGYPVLSLIAAQQAQNLCTQQYGITPPQINIFWNPCSPFTEPWPHFESINQASWFGELISDISGQKIKLWESFFTGYDENWFYQTVYHEYGHWFHYRMAGNILPVAPNYGPCNGHHSRDCKSSGELAFIEGFAEFFSNHCMAVYRGNGDYDGAENFPLNHQSYTGTDYEGLVESFLWDLIDNPTNDDDGVALNPSQIRTVIQNAKPNTITDFVNEWKILYGEENLARLYYLNFNFPAFLAGVIVRKSDYTLHAAFTSIEDALDSVRSNEIINVLAGTYLINTEADLRNRTDLSGVTLKFDAGCIIHVNESIILPSNPDNPSSPINTNKITGSLNVTLIPPIPVYNSYKADTGSIIALVNRIDSIHAKVKYGQTVGVIAVDSSWFYPAQYILLADVSLVGQIVGGKKPRIVFTGAAVSDNQRGLLIKDVIFENQMTNQDSLSRFFRFGSTAPGAIANSELNGVDFINSSSPGKSRALEVEYNTGNFKLTNCNFVNFYIPIDAGYPNGKIPTDTSRPKITYCDWSTCVQGPRGVPASSPSDVFRSLSYCNFGVSPSPFLRYGFQQNPFLVSNKDSVALYTINTNRFNPPTYVDALAKDCRMSPNISANIDVDSAGNDIGTQDYTICQFSNFISPTVMLSGNKIISLTRNDLGSEAEVIELTNSFLNPIINIKIKKNLAGQTFRIMIERRQGYAIPTAPSTFKIASVSTNGAEVLNFIYSDIPPEGQSITKKLTVDNIPPAKPASFRASSSGNDIYLTWLPNSEQDFQAYRIHRSLTLPVPIEPSTQIVTLEKPSTSYTDFGAANFAYNYAIVAYDKVGNLSIPNTAISAKYIFVDDNGNDQTGDGSVTKPYKTINKAVSTLPANPTTSYVISIFPGEYSEGVKLNNPNRIWTSVNRLLFEPAYSSLDSMPLWRGPANNHAPCLEIQKEAYVTVEGFRFQAALPVCDKRYGRDLWNKIFLRIPSLTKEAISLGNDADNISVKRCYFLGTNMRKLFTGIEAGDNVDFLKIENCIFIGLADGAIKNANQSVKQTGFAVVNNTFHKCGYAMSFIDGCGASGCPGSDFVFANNIITSSSSGFAFSGPVPKKDCKIKISNCAFNDLPKGIVIPPCLTKYYMFIDTLIRNPHFVSTDEAQYWNPAFMKPTLPAVLAGGLNATFTPAVDFFNRIRDIPVTIGAVEGAQPAEKKKGLAKEAIAGIIAPLEFKMYGNYPNPFRQATAIRFQIPGTEILITSIDILSLNGRVIKTILNESKTPGYYTVSWDGRGNSNQAIPGGTYLYRLKAGNYHDVKRMILLK